jgi:hypothetical protein
MPRVFAVILCEFETETDKELLNIAGDDRCGKHLDIGGVPSYPPIDYRWE